jgi:hypothetical protein
MTMKKTAFAGASIRALEMFLAGVRYTGYIVRA